MNEMYKRLMERFEQERWDGDPRTWAEYEQEVRAMIEEAGE